MDGLADEDKRKVEILESVNIRDVISESTTTPLPCPVCGESEVMSTSTCTYECIVCQEPSSSVQFLVD